MKALNNQNSNLMPVGSTLGPAILRCHDASFVAQSFISVEVHKQVVDWTLVEC